MSFQQIIQDHKKLIPIYEEIGRKNALSWKPAGEGKFRLDLQADILSTTTLNYLAITAQCDELVKILIYTYSKVFGLGPKVFRPTSDQLVALEDIVINLDFEDYNQPFDTIVVELPEQYAKSRSVISDTNTIETPSVVIVVHDRVSNTLIFNIMMDNGVVLTNWRRFKDNKSLEYWFEHEEKSLSETDQITKSEFDLTVHIRRAIANYCLLLDEVGVKKHGPINQTYYDRLTKFAAKKNDKQTAARCELRSYPIVYEINQEVKLHTVLPRQSGSSTTVGYHVDPHHRRAHYRMQRYGEGLKLKKRIRIAPMFIHADCFVGPMSNSITTYK